MPTHAISVFDVDGCGESGESDPKSSPTSKFLRNSRAGSAAKSFGLAWLIFSDHVTANLLLSVTVKELQT